MNARMRRAPWLAAFSAVLVPTLALVASPPQEQRRVQAVSIPTRDGILLATDLHFPGERGGRFPTVLIRTPYGRRVYQEMGDYFSARGYVVAVQDVRGRPPSGGRWEPAIHEGEDGYDAVEWLATQAWSNGSVGTIGASYDGWTQFLTALERPPHLKTVIPNVPDGGPFHNFPYENGVFFTYGAISWLDALGSGCLKKDPSWMNRLGTLPVSDLMEKLCGQDNETYREWTRHGPGDAYWDKADYLDRLAALKIPVFLQGGWFDTATSGATLAYQKLRGAGNRQLKLIVGPWAHSAKSSTTLAGMDFGEAAGIDLYRLYSRWFDCWLKGTGCSILDEPRVQLFLVGPNRWLEGDTYPLPGTRVVELLLASDRGANTSRGDGTLLRRPRGSRRAYDTYIYDPGDPTPGVTSRLRQGGVKTYADITGTRQDILVFDTAPLNEPLDLAGPLSARIFASSTARDTDWVAYLAALDETGSPVPIGRGLGLVRARFRNSLRRPELLVPGRIYEYTIDLWQTGRRIPAGWRLRLEISSSYAPTYSRNLNTGGNNERDTQSVKAEQRIYHSATYPSRLLLSVADPRD